MLAALSRVSITVLVVVAATVASWFFWRVYVEQPWTRDGHVRADVIAIAPDVSGQVVDVPVKDNQVVRKGDLLFTIDSERYRLALSQAESTLQGRQSEREQRQREVERRNRLSSVAISEESREQATTALATAQAAERLALVERGTARLNLTRTEVRSPVNGFVTNLQVNPGDYASAGKPMLAVVNSDSFYVAGYFEETKLRGIHEGDRASIRLMSFGDPLQGHVDSIARAIADRETAQGSELVANVNPTFSWVRLAQRIPVRIAIDQVPSGVRLSAGMTATVVIEPSGPGSRPNPAPGPIAGQTDTNHSPCLTGGYPDSCRAARARQPRANTLTGRC